MTAPNTIMAIPAARGDPTLNRYAESKAGLSFARAAPMPMSAMLVLIQARKVRSLARYSVARFPSGTLGGLSGFVSPAAFIRGQPSRPPAPFAGPVESRGRAIPDNEPGLPSALPNR